MRPPQRQYCAVTGAVAKYFDPITQLPYANVQAFKVLREAYQQQLAVQNNKKSQEQSPEQRRRLKNLQETIQVA